MIVDFYNEKSTKNVGDNSSSPALYFDFNCQVQRRSIYDCHKGRVAIIGGGGLLSDYYSPYLEKIVRNYQSVILWGVGTHQHQQLNYAKFSWLKDCALVGVRDYSTPYPWVPCVSCMSGLFDPSYTIAREAVTFLHAGRIQEIRPVGAVLTNYRNDMGEVVRFLASAKKVYTNSYHGMYWCALLGTYCVVKSWNEKFSHLGPVNLFDARRRNYEFYTEVSSLLRSYLTY